MLPRDREIKQILIGRRKLAEAFQNVGIRLQLLLAALVLRAAEIDHKLHLTAGHLTPLSGRPAPAKTSVSLPLPPFWPGLLPGWSLRRPSRRHSSSLLGICKVYSGF